MISTVTQHTGAVVVTPPVLGVRSCRSTEEVVLMAPYAAPWKGTGVPAVGITSPIRLRDLIADVGTTGSRTTGVAFAAATVQHKSSTPGDQPPEDPLS